MVIGLSLWFIELASSVLLVANNVPQICFIHNLVLSGNLVFSN